MKAVDGQQEGDVQARRGLPTATASVGQQILVGSRSWSAADRNK